MAHLDRNNKNSSLDNLAYLCLDHHDEYDSTTSQSKRLTVGEIKEFRSELRNAVEELTRKSVIFGSVTLDKRDPYVGHYVRENSDISWSAEIDVAQLPDSVTGDIRYFVSGLAIFGGHRPHGPNIGVLEFFSNLHEGRLNHIAYIGDERDKEPHVIEVAFKEDGLTLLEENYFGRYGMNVSFKGDYRRNDKVDYSDWYWENEDARRLFNAG